MCFPMPILAILFFWPNAAPKLCRFAGSPKSSELLWRTCHELLVLLLKAVGTKIIIFKTFFPAASHQKSGDIAMKDQLLVMLVLHGGEPKDGHFRLAEATAMEGHLRGSYMMGLCHCDASLSTL